MYLMASATDMSSLVTFSSAQNQKSGGRIWRRGHKYTYHLFSDFLLHLIALFAGDKADGMDALAWEFHEHDGLERMFVSGKRIVDLFDAP